MRGDVREIAQTSTDTHLSEAAMTTTTPPALTGTYLLDATQTRLGFVARHTMGPKVRGAFETFDGRAYLDFAEPERSTVEVTVELSSVNTHNGTREKHLRTKYFDAANHPRMVFRSTAIHRLQDDRLRLTGDLTIRGHTRPLTVDVTYTGAGRESDGNARARFEGRATMSRTNWGVNWIAPLDRVLVSDKITLELEIAALKVDADH
jgi:polyisoprenoid-binding protein YceI